MALRIFDVDVDPDAAPKKRFTDDVVGRFRSGAQVNRRPLALDEWRVTTGDPEVADAIAARFGGTPQEWAAQGEDNIEVYTTTPSVDIILDGPDAVRQSMVLWGRNGLIRTCDGVTQKDDQGSPCACPSALKDRKEAAKAGHGCEPSIQVYFRLADDPDLGKLKFFSGSWSMARDLVHDGVEDALRDIDGPARATLSIEKVEWETKEGTTRSFMKPVLAIKGAA
jgi:hypothetical protein